MGKNFQGKCVGRKRLLFLSLLVQRFFEGPNECSGRTPFQVLSKPSKSGRSAPIPSVVSHILGESRLLRKEVGPETGMFNMGKMSSGVGFVPKRIRDNKTLWCY